VRPLALPRGLPQPPAAPVLGHLWQWTTAPVSLLAAGGRAGPVFGLRLWRPAVVGYRPDWNRAVLGDLDTFRSRGSLSGRTPYLAGGVVQTDPPDHQPHRRSLNPHFHARAVAGLAGRLRAVVDARLPAGEFDGLAWAGEVVRRMLGAALFGGRVPDPLLAGFLAPLHRRPPAPLLPRPRLFRRLEAAIAGTVADPPAGSLAEALAGTGPGAVEELRVALAAGYDTTAHTLAWALWHLAGEPGWAEPAALPLVLDEVLRLYPAGWLGSRVTSRQTSVSGVDLPAGMLVLYSPYLTHRDPGLWPDPGAFRPDRFRAGRPAWGFVPFAAGPRTCLGAALARLMLRCALEPFLDGRLRQRHGDPAIRASITLRPRGPLVLHHAGRPGRPATGQPSDRALPC
jgi:cytochrome P450